MQHNGYCDLFRKHHANMSGGFLKFERSCVIGGILVVFYTPVLYKYVGASVVGSLTIRHDGS